MATGKHWFLSPTDGYLVSYALLLLLPGGPSGIASLLLLTSVVDSCCDRALVLMVTAADLVDSLLLTDDS